MSTDNWANIAGGAGFVANFVLWNESGYFDRAAETKPLLHLWSLGIEEQFYIVFPLLLWLAWKRRVNLLTITVAIALVSFGLNISKYKSDAVADFHSPQTRFWELMIGAVLAYTQLGKQDIFAQFKRRLVHWLGRTVPAHRQETNGSKLRNAQSIVGAMLIVVGAAVVTKEDHFPGWWALLPTLGAVLVISAGAQAWINRWILSNRILVWFGLISFPLYLWHWVLLSFAHINEGGIPISQIRITAVLVSIVLAWLTYTLVEKPLRFGKHSNAKTSALLVLMAVVGGVGYSTYARSGLPFFVPKVIQEVAQSRYDAKQGYREGSCFLDTDQDYTTFNSCVTHVDARKKTLLLWGDSHAAHLYPGYQASFSDKFNIVQRTASGCPPITGMEIGSRPHCKKINDYVMDEISRLRPDKVVLAANWQEYDWKQIDVSIIQLKKIGIASIDVVGPVPQWKESLPRQMYLYFRSDPLHRVPDRMEFGLDHTFLEVDVAMSQFTTKLGVNYLSPAGLLCNEAGCITRFGETSDSLSAWDDAHLTSIGSIKLVSQFPRN